MSDRRTSVFTWRHIGWLALVGLLVLPITLTRGDEGRRPGQKAQADERMVMPGPGAARDERPAGLAEAELRFIDKMKRQMFSRPDWWPYENDLGLARYGDVASSELGSPDVLRAAAPVTGKPGYYIVQFAPSAAAGRGSLELRKQIGDQGGQVIEYVPNNAFLVKIDGKARHNFDNPSQFQYVTPYQPADKISPKLGRMPLLNPERAVSDTFSLVVQVMPGESGDDVASDVERLGGTVTKRHEVAGTQWVSANLRNTKVIQLAKNPAVKWIYEAPENVVMNLVTSAMVEVGRFLDPREFGDFVLPYRNAGIDGSGIPVVASAADKDFTGGAVAGFDSALGNYEVAPQFLGVADNGLTLDSPSFAHDNSAPCVGGSCVNDGTKVTNVGQQHRKVEAYIRGSALDVTASGDFLTCDGIRSGGVTHGTLAAGGAAANPSGGINGLGRQYSDVDSVDLFVAFFNDTRESNLSLDGQARGSRVIFEDIATTPPSSPPACAVNFLSDVDSGDVPADRLADMAYRHDINPVATTDAVRVRQPDELRRHQDERPGQLHQRCERGGHVPVQQPSCVARAAGGQRRFGPADGCGHRPAVRPELQCGEHPDQRSGDGEEHRHGRLQHGGRQPCEHGQLGDRGELHEQGSGDVRVATRGAVGGGAGRGHRRRPGRP